MKTVSAREANQRFSKLLAAAEAGQQTTITRRGRPVAMLVPVAPGQKDARRRAAARRALASLSKLGIRMDGRGFTRDEMHER